MEDENIIKFVRPLLPLLDKESGLIWSERDAVKIVKTALEKSGLTLVAADAAHGSDGDVNPYILSGDEIARAEAMARRG